MSSPSLEVCEQRPNPRRVTLQVVTLRKGKVAPPWAPLRVALCAPWSGEPCPLPRSRYQHTCQAWRRSAAPAQGDEDARLDCGAPTEAARQDPRPPAQAAGVAAAWGRPLTPGALLPQQETGRDERCATCKRGADLQPCGACPGAYHLGCLDPPLKTAPKGVWLCPKCQQKVRAPVWPGGGGPCGGRDW